MKKIFLLIFLCIFTLGFSQKKKKAKVKAVVEKETVIIYTEEEAENSKELRVIAGFLKQNPGHAKTEYFKKKLMLVMLADTSSDVKLATTASMGTIKTENTVKGSSLKDNNKNLASNAALASLKAERAVHFASVTSAAKTAGVSKKAEPSDESKRTAAMLTHIFNNDINKNEAYINIRNKSKCPLNVKINGRKSYTLLIPAKSQNFILIDKGDYTLSTMVCDAAYSSLKKIDKDIEIALNVVE